MKEAAGEANMTVITIILIGIIAAVAYPMIKGLIDNQKTKAECLDDGGTPAECGALPSGGGGAAGAGA